MSVPSRDLIDSIGPSTASMTPRMRTVGGCCADATEAAKTTASKASSEEGFGMTSLPGLFFDTRETPRLQPCSARAHANSHRRRQPVAADADAAGFERAIRQLFGEGDDLGTGLEVGLVGGDIGDNRRLGRNLHLLFTALVFDQQRVAVIADDGLGHR